MSKRIAITGASQGIGRALSLHLAQGGHHVMACARSPTAPSNSIDFSSVDLRSPKEIEGWAARIQSRVDHLDMLINNAAVLGERCSFAEIPSSTWAEVIETNVLGVVNTTKYLLPLLGGIQRSTIVNVGSILGRFGRSGWTTYSVSKFAIEGLTQCLAQELAMKHIEVLCLHPPRIRTMLRRKAYPQEELEDEENLEEVLRTVDYLLGHRRCSYSGLTLSVNDLPCWREAPREALTER